MTVLPSVGDIKSHVWQSAFEILPRMGTPARHRLRDALKRLIEQGVTWNELLESDAVSNGTLGRILGEDGQDVTLRQLDLLAEALDIEPWQLLHPDVDLAGMSKTAMKIARKMDQMEPSVREQAYSLFVQTVDFANVPTTRQADAASAPSTAKPTRLRRVHR